MKNIEREKYLNELISLQNNGMIKVITGMRRSGKSYLLLENAECGSLCNRK